MATIDKNFIEHTRCKSHLSGALATKPLQWDPIWGPLDER